MRVKAASILLAAVCAACSGEPGAGAGGDARDASDAGTVDLDAGRSGMDAAAEEADSGDDHPSEDTRIRARYRPVADAFEAERIQLGAPGAVLLVLEGGEVAFARGFGRAHPNEERLALSTTLFRIGSLTKLLTSIALLQLVEEDLIDLDGSLSEALPDFDFARDSSWATSIRVRDLLQHSSALVEMTTVDVAPEQQADDALAGFVDGDFARTAYAMAPPGIMYDYSNSNFYLAGRIVERARGMFYREAMHEHVFARLGIPRVTFSAADVFADGEWAAGLTSDALGGSAIVEPDGYDNAWARPAGFAFASARDLGRVLRFLRDGDLSVLDPSLLAEAQSPQINTEELGDLAHYGYALRVLEGLFFGAGEFRRMRVVTHGGAIPGFSAELWWFPALDLGIVTLANTDGAYFRETVVTALRELTLLPPPEPPPDVAPDPNDLAGYAGTYFDRFNVGSVAVELDGGGLRVSLPALDRAGIEYEPALLPVARRNFLFTVQGHPLLATFVGNPPRFFRTRPFIAERAMTARSVGRSSRFDAARFLESVRSAAPPPWWLPPASP